MKLIDKLKNALFEEEYVEIEEKPKKVKEKSKKVKIDSFSDYEEDKPVAKRIVPQEKKTIETLEETNSMPIIDNEVVTAREEPKIPVVNDEDLKVDDSYQDIEFRETPKRRSDNYIDEVIEEEPVEIVKEEVKEVPRLYQASRKESYLDNYTPHEYGNYEKQKEKEKQLFKPSPIISPIYGIVEDTRFMNKEPRREVRITTSVSHEKMDIDQIRRKAFGNLSDDISDNVGFEEKSNNLEKENIDNNVLLDLSGDDTPQVNEITVGDAVEYFEDLGLEYNEDYIDSSKMTRAQKNASLNEEEKDEETFGLKEDNKDNADVIVREVSEDNNSDGSNENLFDLIDSMYE